MENGFKGDDIGKEARRETIEIIQVRRKMVAEMGKAEAFQSDVL